jgi:hypothetical protein
LVGSGWIIRFGWFGSEDDAGGKLMSTILGLAIVGMPVSIALGLTTGVML